MGFILGEAGVGIRAPI